MAMKKLILLFSLCSLLANTELRAQVYVLPTTDDDKRQLLRMLCIQACYSKYKKDIEPNPEKALMCLRYGGRQYCDQEYIRARAREEYEMCLLSCQY
jgi:hypothetical protein